MPYRIAAVILAIVVLAGAVLWHRFGPFNGPAQPLPRDAWEALIRERIKVPAGYRFEIFARDLGQPRLMQLTATGDLIISGYRNGDLLLVKADRDGDGRSDGTVTLAQGLDLPHGLLLEGQTLYVAEQTAVVKYDFDGTKISNRRTVLDGLPTGGNHTSRTLKRGPDGWLYLSIGSSCNSCIEDNPWRAAMLRFKEGEKPEIFASGLRNTVGFDWQPGTGQLYGVDNGRDTLGDDVPDDEVNLIAEGRTFGWPFVHGMGVADPALFAQRPPGFDPVAPVHGLGAHVAPLSIRFRKETPQLALVAEHGSWNRTVKAGYRIVQLDFSASPPKETVYLSGCETHDDVICRPVDILEADDGGLYVTDDYAGAVYGIVKAL